MKVKTEELSGVLLDYAVAKCEGLEYNSKLNYSQNWELTGELIDKYKIGFDGMTGRIVRYHNGQYENYMVYGSNAIECCLRVYVMSKLGNTVHIPVCFAI